MCFFLEKDVGRRRRTDRGALPTEKKERKKEKRKKERKKEGKGEEEQKKERERDTQRAKTERIMPGKSLTLLSLVLLLGSALFVQHSAADKHQSASHPTEVEAYAEARTTAAMVQFLLDAMDTEAADSLTTCKARATKFQELCPRITAAEMTTGVKKRIASAARTETGNASVMRTAKSMIPQPTDLVAKLVSEVQLPPTVRTRQALWG